MFFNLQIPLSLSLGGTTVEEYDIKECYCEERGKYADLKEDSTTVSCKKFGSFRFFLSLFLSLSLSLSPSDITFNLNCLKVRRVRMVRWLTNGSALRSGMRVLRITSVKPPLQAVWTVCSLETVNQGLAKQVRYM